MLNNLRAVKSSDLPSRLQLQLPSPETKLPLPSWETKSDVQVFMKRDDLIHPLISGNKWRKLEKSLHHAVRNNVGHIISFGGGHSNHLHALAYCCQNIGIHLQAIVRGDYSQNMTPTLLDLTKWGVNIQFVNKTEYQQRYDKEYIAQLQHSAPNALIIPEGGSSDDALAGVAKIITELRQSYDFICCPVASGGTLAGLANAIFQAKLTTQPIGIAMLKGQQHLETLVQELLPDTVPFPTLLHDFHAGGFAKKPPWLVDFCETFHSETAVNVEPVYSGKLCYAVKELITREYFPQHSRVLILHTGGLQGARKLI